MLNLLNKNSVVGFILLYRDILEWEWYQNATVSRLFIHLLLKVNFTDKQWQGYLIKRGQLITSISHLSNELSLSNQEIRTALKKLQSSGYITRQSTNKFTIITVVNYSLRQSESKLINKQNITQATNKQLSNNKQITTTKERKNNKKINNETIEVRRENFKKQVFEHSQYNKTLLMDFFAYWSEYDEISDKMKKEGEKYFEVATRLEKWKKNERPKNFKPLKKENLILNR